MTLEASLLERRDRYKHIEFDQEKMASWLADMYAEKFGRTHGKMVNANNTCERCCLGVAEDSFGVVFEFKEKENPDYEGVGDPYEPATVLGWVIEYPDVDTPEEEREYAGGDPEEWMLDEHAAALGLLEPVLADEMRKMNDRIHIYDEMTSLFVSSRQQVLADVNDELETKGEISSGFRFSFPEIADIIVEAGWNKPPKRSTP